MSLILFSYLTHFIQAQNLYGWSDPSPIFVFHTAHELEKGEFLIFFYFTKLQRKYFLFPGQSFKQNWGNSQLMANNAQIYDCFSATHTILISLVQFNMIHLISD